MDILQYFGFIYFGVASHIKKHPTKTENTVLHFIIFFHFFLIVQNLILAGEGVHGWPVQRFPWDNSLSHDMKVTEKAAASQRSSKTSEFSLISS